MLFYSSKAETSKYVDRQAEANKASVLWMHVQKFDFRLVT